MIDERSLGEIKVAHPMPWAIATVPGNQNGMARIYLKDRQGLEVPLSVMLKVIHIVTTKLGEQAP